MATKNPEELIGKLAPKITQRELAVKYGDFLKAHPENIQFDENGDEIWDDGRAFLDSIGFKGTKDDWQRENPGVYLYRGYFDGVGRQDEEWVKSLKRINPKWYYDIGYDDGSYIPGKDD